MRKTVLGCAIACLMALLSGTAACGLASSAGHAASSLAKSVRATTAAIDQPTATATAPPPTAPASPTTPAPVTTVTTTTTTTTIVPPTSASATSASATSASATSASATSSVSPSVTSATATPSSSSGSKLIWLWVALAVVAFIGLIGWIAHAHRRRVTTESDWQTRLIDVYARGAALHDAMTAAEAQGVSGTADAAARWADIQRRADDFAQLLYMLQETAPDDEDRMRIAGVLASLQAAHSAMAAERSSEAAAGTMANVVRDRLAYFMASLQDLREPYAGPV